MVCDQSLRLDGLQVLVVDSDPDSRELLTMLLEEYGVETIAATDVRLLHNQSHHHPRS